MLAGFRILVAVILYRLKRLEMFNLAGAASIAVALRLSPLEIAVRVAFAFALNALVYLNNDYIDIAIDLKSSDKDAGKARFLADNLNAALWAQWILVVILVLAALAWDWGLLVPLFAGGGICWWYSAQLKRMPYVDILAMMVWGVTMPLCGSPLLNPLGLIMVVQLGLFSGVFEAIQVMRDADDDALEGVRTTGVVLGKARTLLLAKAIMLASTAYALLLLQPIAAAVSVVALVFPFDPRAVERYWTRVKLVYGVTWLVICGWVFWHGQTGGLLASLGSH
jgi:4-hydroxybenzoate polyprenyltransferase